MTLYIACFKLHVHTIFLLYTYIHTHSKLSYTYEYTRHRKKIPENSRFFSIDEYTQSYNVYRNFPYTHTHNKNTMEYHNYYGSVTLVQLSSLISWVMQKGFSIYVTYMLHHATKPVRVHVRIWNLCISWNCWNDFLVLQIFVHFTGKYFSVHVICICIHTQTDNKYSIKLFEFNMWFSCHLCTWTQCCWWWINWNCGWQLKKIETQKKQDIKICALYIVQVKIPTHIRLVTVWNVQFNMRWVSIISELYVTLSYTWLVENFFFCCCWT